jgi:hypothetical protein
MRKLLLILTLAMQVSQPVPGQETGATGQLNNAGKKANGDKGSSNDSLAVKPSGTSLDSKDKLKPAVAENKEQVVKLTDIPELHIADKEKDWLDHAFDWGPCDLPRFSLPIAIWKSRFHTTAS